MRRPIAGIWDVPAEGITSALAATAICFFLGGVAGCIMAANVQGSGSDSLSAYIRGFLSVTSANNMASPAFFPLVWDVLRWPLLSVVLGFTALGVIGIPILFTVRGFLLSFAISSFVRMFGGIGGLLAGAIFGTSGVIAIPALFVVGVQALAASRRLAGRALGEGRRNSPFGKAYFLRCSLCAGVLCVCILLEYLAVPALVSGLAGILPM